MTRLSYAARMQNTFGARLRALRKQRKLTQVEAAEAIGVGRPYLSLMELDLRDGNFDIVKAAADFFGVTVDYLVYGGVSDKSGSDVPSDEAELLALWRRLSDDDKAIVLTLMESMLKRRS
ncbi:helix-turn-helix domain-containing protein [Sorlinia euscelidii]|uniref:helix-turn-helix domain-containing protein n=1 Tax=Sorlinia euscelidii TaxID=3081148 RepID=UPI003AAC6CFD